MDITLTPSHSSIMRLVDFFIDEEVQPVPDTGELAEIMHQLSHLRVKRLYVKGENSAWTVTLKISDNEQYVGTDADFQKAAWAAVKSAVYKYTN